MARGKKDEGSPPLFDLPLQAPPASVSTTPEPDSAPVPPTDEPEAQPSPPAVAQPPEPVPLFEEESPAEPEVEAPAMPPEPRRLTAADRLMAGLGDLGTVLGVGLLLALGAFILDAPLTLAVWPAWLLLLLAFSFLYSVIPLAFWGRTPGMFWRRIVSRARDGGPLTFGQTALRWLGAVLTVGLAGLPLVLLATGRSLSDRVSGSAVEAE